MYYKKKVLMIIIKIKNIIYIYINEINKQT